MTDPKPTVFEAWSKVMGAVQTIEKSERNRDQGFNFRGIDTVVNAVGPVLREHQVIVIPTAEEITTERYTTAKGTAMKSATVLMRYTVYGPTGDSLSGVAYGEAADSGDKAVSKAQSVAYRVFLLQGLTIPTNEPDPDSSSHDRAAFNPEAQTARDELVALCEELGIGLDTAMNDYAKDNKQDIRQATDPGPIRALTARYLRESKNPPDAGPPPDFAADGDSAGDAGE